MKADGGFFWNSPNAYASNSSGFSALPGGWRSSVNVESYEAGKFYDNGEKVGWWTFQGYIYSVFYNWQYIDSSFGYGPYPNNGRYVRCLRD